MSTATVKVVGLNALLKKLDATQLIEPEKTALLKEAADQTKESLRPTVPRATGASVSKLAAVATPAMAKVTLPRYPLIFLEAGSQYNDTGAARVHKRKTAAQWKAGRYRITPRRFLTKERTRVRKRLIDLIGKMKQRVEKRWAAR